MQEWIGRVVEPSKLSDNEMEWLVNSGMRMRITGIRDTGDDVYLMDVDMSEFVEYNKPFLERNFYDKEGVARLNAYESGWLKSDHKDQLYVESGTAHKMFNIIEF